MVYNARRLIVILLLLMLAGVFLLMNPPEPSGDMPDLRAWADGSVLQWLINVLSLGHEFPTASSLAIKSLIFRGGVTVLAVFALVAWGLSIRRDSRPAHEDSESELDDPAPLATNGVGSDEREQLLDESIDAEPDEPGRRDLLFGRPIAWRHPGGLGWALILMGCFLLWTAASVYWSHAGSFTITWSEQFAFVAVLAAAIGLTLSRRQVRTFAGGWLVIATLAGGLLLWHQTERAPDWPLRLFTQDPRELAGVFLPVMLLAAVIAAERLARLLFPASADDRRGGGVAAFVALLLSAALLGLVIFRCGEAAAWTAGASACIGLATVLVILTRRSWRMLSIAGLAAALLLAAWLAVASPSADIPAVATEKPPTSLPEKPVADHGRWAIAGQIFAGSPVIGRGGWGFRLLADSHAAEMARTDPRLADVQISDAGNQWLELLVDFGIVGVLMVAAALGLLLAAAGRAVGRSPWRRHRFLLAGLAGGLAAMLAHQLFASSLDGYVFPAVLGTWVGLVAAAARWSQRPLPEKGLDEYRWGFYPGGLTFLAGALMVATAVGFLVVQDWIAARNYYRAAMVDGRRSEQLRQEINDRVNAECTRISQLVARRLGSDGKVAEGDLDFTDPQLFLRLEELSALTASRRASALQASHYSMQPQIQYASMEVMSDALVQLVQVQVEMKQRARQMLSPVLARFGRAFGPVETTTSGKWAQDMDGALLTCTEMDRIHPAHPAGIGPKMARIQMLNVRGRALANVANPVIQQEMLKSLETAGQLLDAHLKIRPTDLPGVLFRLTLSDPRSVAGELMLPSTAVERLIQRAGLNLTAERRLEMLRDAQRDHGLIGGNSERWLRLGGKVVGRPIWSPMPGRFYDELADLERVLDPEAWERLLTDAAAGELRALSDVNSSEVALADPGKDEHVRNAPQTFCLFAERELLRNHILMRDGVRGWPGGSTWLQRADDWLARAGALYKLWPEHFALQRIMVALRRAQLAWAMEGAGSEKSMSHLSDARAMLDQVDRAHYLTARRAIAVVAMFLHAEREESAVALEWARRTGYLGNNSLETFRKEIATEWQGWLLPTPARKDERDEIEAGKIPATQPEAAKTSLWPLRPPRLRIR